MRVTLGSLVLRERRGFGGDKSFDSVVSDGVAGVSGLVDFYQTLRIENISFIRTE